MFAIGSRVIVTKPGYSPRTAIVTELDVSYLVRYVGSNVTTFVRKDEIVSDENGALIRATDYATSLPLCAVCGMPKSSHYGNAAVHEFVSISLVIVETT